MNNTEKLAMHTPSIADGNFAALAALFPNVVTETIVGYEPVLDKDGNPVVGLDGMPKESAIIERAIDADVLAQEINSHVVSGKEERYQFTWPDKRKSMLLANAPIAAALRPCREESVDFDTTENLYIEGDNLDVLKLLRETYLNRVKVIYIDPPYNTSNDFIYNDDFSEDADLFLNRDGQYDEQGNRLTPNLDSNGRFHTDWLNMIYPRLRVARDMLTIDGVIFISIGDGELKNIQKACDEVFGSWNNIGLVPRLMKTGGNKGRFFSPNIDYILVYAKDINSTGNFKGELDEKLVEKLYNKIETEGSRKGEKYRPFGLYQSSLDARPNQRYYVECPDGTFAIPPGKSLPEYERDGEMVLPERSDGCWRWSKERYLDERAKNNLVFIKSPNGVLIQPDGKPSKWNVYTKIWLSDREEEGQTPTNFISKFENRHSAKELKELNLDFDFAKPVGLIKYLVSLIDSTENSIICDFFSGSATTAHAVMQLNAEDGGKRKFIMVQLPEVCPPDGEAAKAGYETICEIGKERIRRAGKKIKEEAGLTAQGLDIGFRVLKLDSSNMKDVYYKADEIAQIEMNLDGLTDNIKPDRTDADLLFQVMLDLGIPLSAKIKQDGKMFTVDGNYLIACFGKVDTALITEIAKKQPYYAVFRDSSFINDSAMVNFEQVFNTYSPKTIRRVL